MAEYRYITLREQPGLMDQAGLVGDLIPGSTPVIGAQHGAVFTAEDVQTVGEVDMKFVKNTEVLHRQTKQLN